MAELICDHVAVLVRDLEAALESLGSLAADAHPVEEFPSEGTRECYVGKGRAKLLLLQSIGPGPYQRALERRGPGLHHVAYAAPKNTDLLEALPGWFLHPFTLKSMPHTLWACRSGLPLLELMKGKSKGDPLVTGIKLAYAAKLKPYVELLQGPEFSVSKAKRTQLLFGDQAWTPPTD